MYNGSTKKKAGLLVYRWAGPVCVEVTVCGLAFSYVTDIDAQVALRHGDSRLSMVTNRLGRDAGITRTTELAGHGMIAMKVFITGSNTFLLSAYTQLW